MTNVVAIDLAGVSEDTVLIRVLGEKLELGGPDGNHPVDASDGRSGWGMNWDALADSLCGLDEGGIWGTTRPMAFPLHLQFQNVERLRQWNPRAFALLTEILESTSAAYAGDGKSFSYSLGPGAASEGRLPQSAQAPELTSEHHIALAVEGSALREVLHVEPLGGQRYRLVHSPGLVYGLAAGDEFEVAPDGSFLVLRRGGNLAVRVLCSSGVSTFANELVEQVSRIGGRMDGRVEKGLSFTIPVASGFEAVEKLFQKVAQAHPDAAWEYGNVYDAEGQELGWWRE